MDNTRTSVRLSVQPLVAAGVLRQVRRGTATSETLSRLIEADPSLAAAALRAANAPYYGASRRVSNVRQAVVLLGAKLITSLAVNGTATVVLREDEYVAPDGFWSYSLSVAIAARTIAQRRGGVKPEDAYTVGLVHDVGALALHQQDAAAYDALSSPAVRTSPRALLDAETVSFGTHHAERGAALLAQWNAPDALVQAVRTHHAVGDAAMTGLARVLVAAQSIAAAVEPYGARAETPTPAVALAAIGMGNERADALVEAVAAEIAQLSAFVLREAS